MCLGFVEHEFTNDAAAGRVDLRQAFHRIVDFKMLGGRFS